MNIQKRINTLRPYVIGIRFLDGVSVVDVVFKDGWKVPKSEMIEATKGDAENNYFMFHTEKEDLGIDDILDWIDNIINMNIEREKKYELLKVKTEQLKDLFKHNTLSVLENMTFVLGNDKLIPDTMPADFNDINIEDVDAPVDEVEPPVAEVEPPVAEVETPITEVETSIAEVETIVQTRFKNQNIELPPKGTIVVESFDEPTVICKCGPDDICPVCIEEKVS